MYFPPEWHEQEFVQLTWPHELTDWAPILDEVYDCFIKMALEISKRENLLILAQKPDELWTLLESLDKFSEKELDRITILPCQNNDTWARDHAFLSCLGIEAGTSKRYLLDYQFNGWGMKFAANLDNQINKQLYPSFNQEDNIYVNHLDFVLEGGSIESDGKGTLLTTSSCLLAPNRNDSMTRADIEKRLLHDLQAKQLLWLDDGYLAGDDTDGHIDTLARLCPNDTIAYVSCSDTSDEHYEALKRMEKQLKSFRTIEGNPFRLVSLPMAPALFEESEDSPSAHPSKKQRLPSTYANFLIINNAVLYPTYGNAVLDKEAGERIRQCFTGREIVGIDCRVLVRQHGSLHCCTMQYPSIK